MKKTVILFLITILVVLGVEVVWEKTYCEGTNAEARCVLEAFDGGYLVAGSVDSATMSSLYLFKTDTAGKVLWQRTYNRGSRDKGKGIISTSDSSYLIFGFATNLKGGKENRDVYVLKVDTAGDTLWQQTYGLSGSEEPLAVTETSDSHFLAVGFTDTYEGKDDDVIVLKLDAGGDTVWMRNYGGAGSERGVDIVESKNGYVVIGTKKEADTADIDIYLVEVDTEGNLLWDDTYGEDGDDWVHDVVITTVGGYLVVGGTTSHRAEGGHVYVFELDKYGGKLWEQLFGGTEEDEAFAGVKIGYTGYLLAGRTASFGAGEDDVYLLEIDRDGNYQWEKTLGGEGDDVATSITRIADGYLVAGSTTSFGDGETRCYLIKLTD